MTNAMTLFDPNQLPATQTGDNAGFDDTSKSSAFLGRLRLYTGTAQAIQLGHVGAGEYGVEIRKDNIHKLGKSVDVIPFARKHMAIDTSVQGAVSKSFEKDSPLYKEIMAKSALENSGCQHGILFLVWERTMGRFLEFYCGTATSRPEADKISAYLPISPSDIAALKAGGLDVSGMEPQSPRPLTLGVQVIKKPQRTWHGPLANRCSTPFANLPTLEQVKAEITKFTTIVAEPKQVAGPATRRAR